MLEEPRKEADRQRPEKAETSGSTLELAVRDQVPSSASRRDTDSAMTVMAAVGRRSQRRVCVDPAPAGSSAPAAVGAVVVIKGSEVGNNRVVLS